MHLPRVIGHRGAAGLAPENTLAGLRKAAELGCGMVEVDVKLTRDGVPILMHDDRLDRTTDGTGAVRNLDWPAIAGLDAGCWFGSAFAGERVPTLAQALALAAGLGLAINLEIKPCPGRERETALVALAQAAALWPADQPPPLVSSFDLESLTAAQEIAPGWPRGYLIWRRPRNWRAVAERLGAATINISQRRSSPARIADYRSLGLPVLAYTVNDAARALTLFGQGVAAVFTDRPDMILAALAERVAPVRP